MNVQAHYSGYRHAGIDGITVLKQIRTIDPQAKVMVFTEGQSPGVESQAKALGGHWIFRKGFALPPIAEFQSRGSQSSK